MSIETPPGWTGDPLSAFLDQAFRNGLAFFDGHRAEWEKLQDIDKAILGLAELHPSGMAGFFLVRCHASFRAAVRLVVAGEISEAYTQQRSAIEWSLYASHVHGEDESRAQVWLRRHDGEAEDGSATRESEEARNRVRSEFTVGRLMASLERRSADVQVRTKALYEHAIDSGAHPNERALTAAMRPEAAGTFQLDYLVPEDSVALKLAVKRTAQVGVCCLDIFELLWPEKFRIAGLDRELEALRRGL